MAGEPHPHYGVAGEIERLGHFRYGPRPVRPLDARFVHHSLKKALLGGSAPRVRLGPYELIERIGQGAGGVVYRARHQERREIVALKTLRFARSNRSLAAHEFQVAADLMHPNLVSLYELSGAEGELFFTMELIEGLDFLTALRRLFQAGDLDALRDLIGQIGSALAYLHSHGRTHCDLKPGNILVSEVGRAVVLDFGLMNRVGWQGPAGGTPPFMAPERTLDPLCEPAPAVDSYAVGVMLCLALSGEGQALSSRGSLPAGIDAPEALVRLTEALLQRDPKERPAPEEWATRLGAARPHFAKGASILPVEGRRDSLELILGQAEQARERGSSMFIRGSRGVGKSAMLDYALGELARQGWQVWRSSCHEGEVHGYGVIDALGETVRRELETLAAEAQAPLVRASHSRLLQVMADLVRRMPTVLAVDDAHWCDRESLVFLEHLSGLQLPGLLILLTEEKDAASLQTRWSGNTAERASTLLLGPLNRISALRLAARARPELDVWRLNTLADQAQGNPRWILDLARTFEGEGGATVSLPHLLEQRIRRLGAEAGNLLKVVTLSEGRLPSAVSVKAAKVDSCAFAALHELRAQRLATSFGSMDAGSLKLGRADVRAAVYEVFGRAWVQGTHLRIAEALSGAGAGYEVELAVHLGAASEAERAFAQACRACDAARRARSPLRLARACEFAARYAPTPEACYTHLLERARSLGVSDQPERAARAYAEAIRLASLLDRPRLRAERAYQLARAGKFVQARRTFERLLPPEDLPWGSSSGLRVRALRWFLAARGQSRHYRGGSFGEELAPEVWELQWWAYRALRVGAPSARESGASCVWSNKAGALPSFAKGRAAGARRRRFGLEASLERIIDGKGCLPGELTAFRAECARLGEAADPVDHALVQLMKAASELESGAWEQSLRRLRASAGRLVLVPGLDDERALLQLFEVEILWRLGAIQALTEHLLTAGPAGNGLPAGSRVRLEFESACRVGIIFGARRPDSVDQRRGPNQAALASGLTAFGLTMWSFEEIRAGRGTDVCIRLGSKAAMQDVRQRGARYQAAFWESLGRAAVATLTGEPLRDSGGSTRLLTRALHGLATCGYRGAAATGELLGAELALTNTDRDGALTHLAAARLGFAQAGMRFDSAIVECCLAEVGPARTRADHLARAERYFAEQCVWDREHLLPVFAPGLRRA